MISINSRGDLRKTTDFLRRSRDLKVRGIFDRYGQMGVEALALATPVDTGRTSASWSYSVEKDRKGWSIKWSNSNRPNGVPIAIMLQYGHGTGTGGWVSGIDYINPAIKPIFDNIAESIWREVRGL